MAEAAEGGGHVRGLSEKVTQVSRRCRLVLHSEKQEYRISVDGSVRCVGIILMAAGVRYVGIIWDIADAGQLMLWLWLAVVVCVLQVLAALLPDHIRLLQFFMTRKYGAEKQVLIISPKSVFV